MLYPSPDALQQASGVAHSLNWMVRCPPVRKAIVEENQTNRWASNHIACGCPVTGANWHQTGQGQAF